MKSLNSTKVSIKFRIQSILFIKGKYCFLNLHLKQAIYKMVLKSKLKNNNLCGKTIFSKVLFPIHFHALLLVNNKTTTTTLVFLNHSKTNNFIISNHNNNLLSPHSQIMDLLTKIHNSFKQINFKINLKMPNFHFNHK